MATISVDNSEMDKQNIYIERELSREIDGHNISSELSRDIDGHICSE